VYELPIRVGVMKLNVILSYSNKMKENLTKDYSKKNKKNRNSIKKVYTTSYEKGKL
jgi:hypothetical protein